MNLKKTLKLAGLGVLGLFALVTLVGFCLPSKILVERSVLVNAAPDAIYPHIASFKDGWKEWNAFQKEDPNMVLTYQGPDQGVGARQSWGSTAMDSGHMEITKADPSRGVEFDLSLMHDSFRIQGSLLCEPVGKQTKVTWTDHLDYGPNPYTRYMGQLVKAPIGKSFEESLQTLKGAVERAPARTATSL